MIFVSLDQRLDPHPLRTARRQRGFSLIEVTIVVAVIGLLVMIAGSNYLAYIEKVRVASAVASIRAIAVELDDFVRSEKPLPATLAEIGKGEMRDPWGYPFSYLPFSTGSPGSAGGSSSDSSSDSSSGSSGGSSGGGSGDSSSGSSGGSSSGSSGGGSGGSFIGGSYLGEARKDHFLVPLNSDYDLYSVGKDGQSRAPLSAPFSADDVIRANDGAYIGLAANY